MISSGASKRRLATTRPSCQNSESNTALPSTAARSSWTIAREYAEHTHAHSKHTRHVSTCRSSGAVHVLFQARQSLEKAKAGLEEERQNLTTELKSLQVSRTESERGRKRAEGQLQEVSARLAQAEREREDREERVHRLQVEMDINTLQIYKYVLLFMF